MDDVTSPSLRPVKRMRRTSNIDWANRPMNINRNQMLKLKLTSIHRCKTLQSYSESNTKTFPAFIMFIISHNTVYKLQRRSNSSTYLLMKNPPATSYVVATFHPTIGQRAHQSLSNTATPELGMIATRNKETKQAHT